MCFLVKKDGTVPFFKKATDPGSGSATQALSYSIYIYFSMIESKSNMVIDFYCAEKSMVEYSGKMEPLATKVLGKFIIFFTELYNSNHNCMVCVMWFTEHVPSTGSIESVLWIRIHMFLGLLDPDPRVRGMDPDSDPSIIMQK